MKKLSLNKKYLLVGGAESKAKKVANTTVKKGSKATNLTRWNSYFHNAGLISVSAIAAVGHFSSSIQELLNKVQGTETEKKYHTYKTALRPNFRFTQSYWNSAITFGMPWYY
ncbi:hypothetical protein A6V39_04290 [Candidatus Mycoplasma haematobovis]|uniref:Uncharacterized protein n=1 Tax=Candidatus Mycoplasma haematobovis TaxID=432608 RepID=A0A1A9QDT2_9MOLU|nr:hypothetical protein [Candidatus Mycoplasma haematobovis]OAL10106.1 hypothetical protein A6V39_04290 [Candidatus Mycoplasma haematobovis]